MKKVWKVIKDYESLYEVSNHGQVRSFHHWRTRVLKTWLTNKDGYHIVELNKDGRCWKVAVHKLVANAFLESAPSPRHIVNHKDGNKIGQQGRCGW